MMAGKHLGGALADKGQNGGTETGDLVGHCFGIVGIGRQRCIAPRNMFGHVGQAEPELRQDREFLGRQKAGCHTGLVKHRPEFIAGSGIIGALTCRYGTRGTAAEHDLEPGLKNIGKDRGWRLSAQAAALIRSRPQISVRASTSFSISSSPWNGVGVRRSRSVPLGTVG